MLDPHDTIAAIATPPGGAARGMVRIAGPQTPACLTRLFHADEPQRLASAERSAVLPGSVEIGKPGRLLPCDLWYWPGQRSYTRSPVAELHTFGSPACLELLLEAVCDAGARLAAPGEFTLRAFLAGRLDLTQAEAVLGVIDARTERSLQVALEQLAGGMADSLGRLRETLINVLAQLEAALDFVDEDIEFISREELLQQLAGARSAVEAARVKMESRGNTEEEPTVVLAGLPNAGKSSLFNALAGHSQAIVSAQPGTTRDYLTARIETAGIACQLIDTAGVEPATAGIAREAQQMTAAQQATATLRLVCIDAGRAMTAWEREQIDLAQETDETLVVLTKIDRPRVLGRLPGAVETSGVTGQGLDRLRDEIALRASQSVLRDVNVVAGTGLRCRDSLRQAAESLQRAQQLVNADEGEELVAAELRVALEAIGLVVGAVSTDDILDRIFSRFCIGK